MNGVESNTSEISFARRHHPLSNGYGKIAAAKAGVEMR
jgi:hypothetical protein